MQSGVVEGGVHRSRFNIVSFRYHRTEQTAHESMRVSVRTAPLARIDTCRLHLVLKTLCGQ